MFLFSCLYPLRVSAPLGHPQVAYTTSGSSEAIMPTTEPLFLLGYTIIIYIFVFVFWLLVFSWVWGMSVMWIHCILLLQIYNIKISNNILKYCLIEN
jgi:hypothetical protein